jgi:hypothetical protein
MTAKEQQRYERVFEKLKESTTKDEFLESVDSLLDEIFESKIHQQHNLDTLYDDDWWTSTMS